MLSSRRTVLEAIAAAPDTALLRLPERSVGIVSLRDALGAATTVLLPVMRQLPEIEPLLDAAEPAQLRSAAVAVLRRLETGPALHPHRHLCATSTAKYQLYTDAVLGALRLLQLAGLEADVPADDTAPHNLDAALPDGRSCRVMVRGTRAERMRLLLGVEVQTGEPRYPFTPGSFELLLARGQRGRAEHWQAVTAADLFSRGVGVGPGAMLAVPAFGRLTGRVDRLAGTEFIAEEAPDLLPGLLQGSLDAPPLPAAPPLLSGLSLTVQRAAETIEAVAHGHGPSVAAEAAVAMLAELQQLAATAQPPPTAQLLSDAIGVLQGCLPGGTPPGLQQLLQPHLNDSVVEPTMYARSLAAALLCRALVPQGRVHNGVLQGAFELTGASRPSIQVRRKRLS